MTAHDDDDRWRALVLVYFNLATGWAERALYGDTRRTAEQRNAATRELLASAELGQLYRAIRKVRPDLVAQAHDQINLERALQAEPWEQ